MPTIDELVKDIQGVLASGGDGQSQDRLGELARGYADACQAVHDKATRCRELLEKGMDAKARRLARTGGDLRQDFAAVDFIEIAAWLDLCVRLVLTLPPLLDSEAIKATLDETFATSGKMERLLREHRRMAIGGAPVAARLQTLRAIAKEEPAEASWKEDLREYERVRHEELAAIAEQARRKRDLQTLEAVLAELRGGDWLHGPPQKFIRAVEKLALPLRQRKADVRYGTLTQQLREAHSAMDEGRCRSLLAQWATVVEATGCWPSAEQADEIEPVKTWLRELEDAREEEAAYEHACAALASALDEEYDRATLERLAAAVLRFGQDMPQLLAARFNSRMEELHRTGKRRFALKLAGVVGGILFLAAGLTFGWCWYDRNQAIARWCDQITPLVDKADLAGAGKLFTQLQDYDPEVFDAPEIQELHGRYEKQLTEDRQRREAFGDTLAAIEAAGVEAEQTDALIERGASLAAEFEEKELIETWRQKRQLYLDLQRRQREAAFEKQLGQLVNQYADVRDCYMTGGEGLQEQAAACRALARKLSAATGVPAGLRARADAIDGGVGQILADVRKRAERREGALAALKTIGALAGRPDDLAGALGDFSGRYLAHPLAPDFLRAVEMAPQWQAAGAWADLTTPWKTAPSVQDATIAARRLAAVEAYLTAHPDGPHRTDALNCRAHLQAVAKAWTGGELLHVDSARRMLTSPLIASLFVLTDGDGRAYYMTSKTTRQAKRGQEIVGVRFEYIINSSLTEKSHSWPTSRILTPSVAPQSRFAQEALGLIRRYADGRDWPTLYLRLAELARQQAGMDPILRAIMIKKFLDFAAETTPGLLQAIPGARKPLDDVDLDVRWMDPNDDTANRVRRAARLLLEGMKPLTPLIERAQEQAAIGAAYRAVGLLLPGAATSGQAGRSAEVVLYILRRDTAGSVGYKKVGTTAKGQSVLDPAALNGVPNGTPLYVRIP